MSAIAIINAEGATRVLNGAAGMTFIVDTFTPGPGGAVAHVRDYRWPGPNKTYTVWSVPARGYHMEEVPEL